MHNKILKEALTEWRNNKRTPNSSSKDLVMTFKKVNEKLGVKTTRNEINPSDSVSIAFVDMIMKNPDVGKMSDFLYENGLISVAVKAKYSEFTSRMLAGQKGEPNFKEEYEKIVAFEWEIVNDKSLAETDRVTLLKLTATAKESFRFWYENRDQYLSGNTHNRTFVQWLMVGVADCSCVAVPWFAALASGAFYVAVGIAK